MKFIPSALPGVFVIEPQVFQDARGLFFESYRKDAFKKMFIFVDFVQDNHSRSAKGTLRGLHYQAVPMAQAKLVRVTRGEAFDAVVDLRLGTTTYGKWEGHLLSAENRKMLYIPAGFAHGFLALKDDTELVYKVSEFYSPAHERGILWNDPDVGIVWPRLDTPIVLSEKDKKFPTFKEIR